MLQTSFIAQATVITIVNYNCNTFTVQATGNQVRVPWRVENVNFKIRLRRSFVVRRGDDVETGVLNLHLIVNVIKPFLLCRQWWPML
jgi:hypothetical protein